MLQSRMGLLGTILPLVPIFLFAFALRAQSEDAPTSNATELEADVANDVNLLSVRLDEFFSGSRIQNEHTGTRLQLGFAARSSSENKPKYNSLINFHLELPNTEKRLHLVFKGIEEDVFYPPNRSLNTPDSSATKSVGQQKLGLGLRHTVHQSKLFAFNLEGGSRWHHGPQVYVQGHARRSLFWDQNEFRLQVDGHWRQWSGFMGTVMADWDRRLKDNLLFTLANAADYHAPTGLWEMSHTANLAIKISERSAASFSTGTFSLDQPTVAIAQYFVSASWRYNLQPDWLYFEISPTQSWPRDRDFSPAQEVVARVDAIIVDRAEGRRFTNLITHQPKSICHHSR